MKRVVAMGLTLLAVFALCITIGISMAQATTVAAAPNKAGGYIVLTPVNAAPNGYTCNKGMVAVAFAEGRTSIMGCWTPVGETVVIEWSVGETSTHQQTDFFPVQTNINLNNITPR